MHKNFKTGKPCNCGFTSHLKEKKKNKKHRFAPGYGYSWYGYGEHHTEPSGEGSGGDGAVTSSNHRIDNIALEKARAFLGIQKPVKVEIVNGVRGAYVDMKDYHLLKLVGWLKPESANRQAWEELFHAFQHETKPEIFDDYHETYDQGHDAYTAHPAEVEAKTFAANPPFNIVLPPT